MTWLLDGNVLVALVLDGHVHHPQVLRWFESQRERRFATCVVTQGTLLRIHMSFAPDRGAAAAWATLKAIEDHPRHEYWDDAFAYTTVPHRHLQGAKQVTDAWLAELARRRRSKLVTLDRSLAILHADVAESVKV
jgi:uncharacterized protein